MMFSRNYLLQLLAGLLVVSVAGLASCEDSESWPDFHQPQQPEVQHPEPHPAEAHQPEAQLPEAQQPPPQQPEPLQPEAEQPEASTTPAPLVDASQPVKGALERILSNEPLQSGQALELLRELAISNSDQSQLNVQSLIELSEISPDKCHPIADLSKDYVKLDKSLGPYLNEHYWKQVDQCKKVFGKHLMEALAQVDGQVRADIEVLAEGLKLPQDHDPYSGVPQNDLIKAIVHFVLNETKRPEPERRYSEQTVFADMKDILVEDCKKLKQAVGSVVDTTNYKVPNHLLSLDELKWFMNAKTCAQLTTRIPATIRLASIVFKSNYNNNNSS